MRLLTEDEKKLYTDLVKFMPRFTVPYKCCMAEHPPEDFRENLEGFDKS